MSNEYQSDPYVLRRYFSLAWKNLRRRPVRTGLTVAGVALAVTVAVSLGGFMLGYSGAIDKSIDMPGFQVMIMAKGCPYEAATMMLKGGTGLLYLPADTYDKVKSDPEIESITPIFVGVAQKQGSSIRDDAGNDLGCDRVGEIVVQSRHLAVGYWRRPDLTQQAFLPDPSGGEARSFRSGDLGRLEAM